MITVHSFYINLNIISILLLLLNRTDVICRYMYPIQKVATVEVYIPGLIVDRGSHLNENCSQN